MNSGPAAPPAGRGPLSLLLTYAVLLTLCVATLGWAPVRAVATPGSPLPGAPGLSVPSSGAPMPVVPSSRAPVTAAPSEEALLQVRLDSVTPAIAGPGADVVVSGTLTNAGTASAQVESVRVSTAVRGLDTREAVDRWATVGDLETPLVLAEDQISAALSPRAVVRFFTRVPAGALDPGFDFATLPLRIEVTGEAADNATEDDTGEVTEDDTGGTTGDATTDPAGGVLPGTELRTFLPWQAAGADTFNPIDLAWVAPLTLPGGAALVDPDDAVRAEAWSAAIGSDSPNVALLTGLSETAATFVIDPAVLEPLDPVASFTEAVQPPEDDPGEPTETPTDPTAGPTGDATATTSPPGTTEEPVPDPTATATGTVNGAPATGSSPDGGGGDGGGGDGTGATGTDPLASTEGPAGDSTAEPTDGPTDEPTGDPEPVEPPTPPTTEAAVLGLSALIAQVPADRLWWLPVGDIDTGALLDLDAEVEDVAALVGRPPAAPLVGDGRTDIAWPLSTGLDDTRLEELAEVWRLAGGATGAAGLGDGSLAGVILPTAVIEGEVSTGSAARPHATGTRLLGYDEQLSGVVAASGAPDLDGRSVQRFLAETMAVYQQRPAEDRSLVVAIPRGADLDADTLRELTTAARAAPWLAETTADQLLDGAAATSPAAVVPPAVDEDGSTADSARSDATGDVGVVLTAGDPTAYVTPGDSPLTTRRVAQVEDARESMGGASEIVPGSEEAHATWQRVLDRQYSARWRQDPAGWSDAVDRAAALSREILTGLTINPTTINFFADEGLIRITVTNDLPVQIDDLRMTVSPGNARLRILAQPDPITIGPESRATVQFRARAIAAGEVPLNTSLSTPNGAPVGEEAETSVRVRPAGVWIYWLLGGVAGVILVLGLVRALRPRSESSASEQKVAPTGSDTESP